jgi:hypothetical protein
MRLTPALRFAVALVVLSWPYALRAQCGAVGFRHYDGYSLAQGYPVSVAVGDLNEDGIPDLVVASRNPNSVSVLLGLGGGKFAPPTNYLASGGWAVVLGDFNRDGHLDVATANGLNGSTAGVEILLGDGHGGLSAPSTVSFATAYSLAVGDFNGDGKLDIVAGRPDGYVTILLGDGTGSFSVAPSIQVNVGGITSVVVGDFDGDGKKDFAVAGSSYLGVLLGLGDGTFGTPTRYPVLNYANYVTAGDLNGDGIPDLVVTTADGETGGNGGHVWVFLGLGPGTFQLDNAAPSLQDPPGVQTLPFSVTIADFDLDGKADIAIGSGQLAGGVSTSILTVFRGDGAGGFSPPVAFPIGGFGFVPSIQAADLNLDGSPDLVLANSSGALTLMNSVRGPLDFYTLNPCRIVDTRTGSPLAGGATTFFSVSGNCSVPTTARVVSANVTVVHPTEAGHITMFAGEMKSTPTSIINFGPGAVRANNAFLLLDGSCGANVNLSAGTSDFVIDVNGYFQ